MQNITQERQLCGLVPYTVHYKGCTVPLKSCCDTLRTPNNSRKYVRIVMAPTAKPWNLKDWGKSYRQKKLTRWLGLTSTATSAIMAKTMALTIYTLLRSKDSQNLLVTIVRLPKGISNARLATRKAEDDTGFCRIRASLSAQSRSHLQVWHQIGHCGTLSLSCTSVTRYMCTQRVSIAQGMYCW